MTSMPTDSINAANAYGRGAALAVKGGESISGVQEPKGRSFIDYLAEKTQDLIGTLRKGEAASVGALTGKTTLPDLVAAVTDADATLQTFIALRDRMINAYQDIMRMPL